MDSLEALRNVIMSGKYSSQSELQKRLRQMGFQLDQSTVSRLLVRLAAYKARDEDGKVYYRIGGAEALASTDGSVSRTKKTMIEEPVEVRHNETLVVVRSGPGTASLVARKIDEMKLSTVLGTIAGDDTMLVIPTRAGQAYLLAQELKKLLR